MQNTASVPRGPLPPKLIHGSTIKHKWRSQKRWQCCNSCSDKSRLCFQCMRSLFQYNFREISPPFVVPQDCYILIIINLISMYNVQVLLPSQYPTQSCMLAFLFTTKAMHGKLNSINQLIVRTTSSFCSSFPDTQIYLNADLVWKCNLFQFALLDRTVELHFTCKITHTHTHSRIHSPTHAHTPNQFLCSSCWVCILFPEVLISCLASCPALPSSLCPLCPEQSGGQPTHCLWTGDCICCT